MAVRPRLRATTIPELEALVFGLGAQSYAQMADPANRGKIPPLYSGKIVYRRELPRREDWQSALETAERGYGDCEDLVAYRLAELRAQGVKDAVPVITAVNPALRHVTLTYTDAAGRVVHEDPSRRLGMGSTQRNVA